MPNPSSSGFGQQQLMLLVLGIIIVGLAVVVGIQARDSSAKKANADYLLIEAVEIASSAQRWKMKPGQFGGGYHQVGFDGVALEVLGYDPCVHHIYQTTVGEYQLVVNEAGIATVIGCSAQYGNRVEVVITGPDGSNDLTISSIEVEHCSFF